MTRGAKQSLKALSEARHARKKRGGDANASSSTFFERNEATAKDFKDFGAPGHERSLVVLPRKTSIPERHASDNNAYNN